MKINVVTGGGSGIGKAVAASLPKNEKVIITGRSLTKLDQAAETLNTEGCHVLTVACDTSVREDVRKLAE